MRSPLPCPICMLHAKTPVHRRCTTTTPASCTVRSISRAFQGPPPRRRPSDNVALGSLRPKSLTLPTSRGNTDLVRKMLIGDQMGLLVISCPLYPLPLRPLAYILGAILKMSVCCEQL